MIIFSERVNGMYRDVRKAINEKEKQPVQDIVKEQVAGGADVMDINLGPTKGDAVENFVWLAQTVAEVTDRAISLDDAGAADFLRSAVESDGLMTIHTEEATLEAIFIELTGRGLEA